MIPNIISQCVYGPGINHLLSRSVSRQMLSCCVLSYMFYVFRCIQNCLRMDLHFQNSSLPSRFSGKKEVEKRERNNTPGRAFSADRFTAKHLTMLGLFGVHLSIRRAEKKKKKPFSVFLRFPDDP